MALTVLNANGPRWSLWVPGSVAPVDVVAEVLAEQGITVLFKADAEPMAEGRKPCGPVVVAERLGDDGGRGREPCGEGASCLSVP